MPMQTYSIYIHIPFCVHRCAYCDFNTYAGLEALIPAYVQALCTEIRLAGAGVQAANAGRTAVVHTVFWGGGTPSLLPLAELEKIISALGQAFEIQPGAELTLEANPGTVSTEYLRGLHSMGINRLSLGMQSAHPSDLMVLERQHRLEDVVQAVRWARQAGFDNLNLDLIFGIPHQSLDSWQRTLSMALSLQPDHLALYALTLEHGTPMAHWIGRGLLPEADSDLAADMYEHASERLESAGFEQYEISNWARQSGNAAIVCRHNLQYWRSLPYLGLGAGAHGFAAGYRTANVLAPAAYITRLSAEDSPALPFPHTPATAQFLTVDDQSARGEMMMMGMRLVKQGVTEADYLARFGQTLEQAYARQIRRLQRLGLLEWHAELDGQRALRLTRAGRLLGNRVFREFV